MWGEDGGVKGNIHESSRLNIREFLKLNHDTIIYNDESEHFSE